MRSNKPRKMDRRHRNGVQQFMVMLIGAGYVHCGGTVCSSLCVMLIGAGYVHCGLAPTITLCELPIAV
jgi:hypothetical protein